MVCTAMKLVLLSVLTKARQASRVGQFPQSKTKLNYSTAGGFKHELTGCLLLPLLLSQR